MHACTLHAAQCAKALAAGCSPAYSPTYAIPLTPSHLRGGSQSGAHARRIRLVCAQRTLNVSAVEWRSSHRRGAVTDMRHGSVCAATSCPALSAKLCHRRRAPTVPCDCAAFGVARSILNSAVNASHTCAASAELRCNTSQTRHSHVATRVTAMLRQRRATSRRLQEGIGGPRVRRARAAADAVPKSAITIIMIKQ